MNVMVVTPRLGKFTPRTVKFNAHTSYLCSFLKDKGIDVIIHDCNWKGKQTAEAFSEAGELQVDALIIVCNNTLVYGQRMKQIIEDCNRLRESKQVNNIWLTGYMATSFQQDIIDYLPLAAGIGDASGIQWIPHDMEDGVWLGKLIVEHTQLLESHPGITKLDDSIPFEEDDRLSLLASRSCNAKCSFCAYNKGQGEQWQPRSVSSVLRDIDYGLHLFGTNRKITFSDNDFLGSRRLAEERVKEFSQGLEKLNCNIKFSINTRADCLTKTTLRILAEHGLTNITMGLESLHADTLRNVYHKKVDYSHLLGILDEADQLGVSILLSYILWQPYLTIEQLCYEIGQMMELGRWRIPQLLVNSIAKVVPMTTLEKKLKQDRILKVSRFERGWSFLDEDVEKLYHQLENWHQNQLEPLEVAISNRSTDSLTKIIAQRKIEELHFLCGYLGIEVKL